MLTYFSKKKKGLWQHCMVASSDTSILYIVAKLRKLLGDSYKVFVSPIVLIDSDFSKRYTGRTYIGSFFLFVFLNVFVSMQVCVSKIGRYHLDKLYVMKNLTCTRFCSSTANVFYISVDFSKLFCWTSWKRIWKKLTFSGEKSSVSFCCNVSLWIDVFKLYHPEQICFVYYSFGSIIVIYLWQERGRIWQLI